MSVNFSLTDTLRANSRKTLTLRPIQKVGAQKAVARRRRAIMASSFSAKRAENVSALLGEVVKRLVDVEVREIPPRYPPPQPSAPTR